MIWVKRYLTPQYEVSLSLIKYQCLFEIGVILNATLNGLKCDKPSKFQM